MHLYGGEKTGMFNFFLCTPIDNTMQKIFYKIKFSFLCTPIDNTMQKFFYKIKFSFLCTPIDIDYFYVTFTDFY